MNLGFLFQKQAHFEAGLVTLETIDPRLAAYLRQARTWSERLLAARNAEEHEGWTLPQVTYARAGDKILATEPTIDGQPATAFTESVFDRLACFVEDVTAHCLGRQLPTLMALSEVPYAERPDERPERFRLTLAVGGTKPWLIAYHGSSFNET